MGEFSRTCILIVGFCGFLATPCYNMRLDKWNQISDWHISGLKKRIPVEAKTANCNVGEVKYFTNLIEAAQRNGLTYEWPANASEYEAKDTNVKNFGTYDFIIVGAGAAGTVLASRLSEISHWKVLVLEAGDFGDNLTDIPNMYFPVEFTKYNWGFVSTPQKYSCQGMVDKKCPMARGKGVGGTTLINGEVYARGSSMDFDRWAKHVKDSKWSYNRVLRYFKKSEDYHHRDKDAPVEESIHGKGGLWNVEYHLPRSPQLNAFLKANIELGVPVADYNAGTGLGASPAQITTINGRRGDGGKAFIRPFLNRKGLTILTNSYVTGILIDKSSITAQGVKFTHQNKTYSALASKEVIVSAGSLQTPQLLMLSGIGPKKHLESFNIPLIKDLEVGTRLVDHPTFYGLSFSSNYTEPIKPQEEYVKEFLKGVGPLAAPGNNQAVGFYESKFTKGTGYPDIEIMCIPANATADLSQRAYRLTDETYEDTWKFINRSQSFLLYIVALHAESAGTLRLKSANPFDYPLINNNFLSNKKDVENIYEGIQIALNLTRTNAFQKINATLQGGALRACKRHKYLTKAYWLCAIRQMSLNLYHPVGTCPMGPNPSKGDVVDSECKVHGVRNLRVADGSVFPFSIAGHPTAPIVLIGEIVSDLIKKDHLGVL